jgi:hypothetical protein
MGGQVEGRGKSDSASPIITGKDEQPPPQQTAGSGSTPTRNEKAGSGNIATSPATLPPVPAEASRSPAPLPNQNMEAVRESARAATKAFLDAKAELSKVRADTSLPQAKKEIQISRWRQQVAILRPAALLLTNNYYVRVEENAAFNAEVMRKGGNDLGWPSIGDDLHKADRLRGQARETKRSLAEDADEFVRVPLEQARANPDQWSLYQLCQEAVHSRFAKWEDAFADATSGGDAEEIEKCRDGLDKADRDIGYFEGRDL